MEKSSKSKFTESKHLMKLQLNDLTIGYQKKLINPINIEVNSGKLIALIGRNGIGKSTFLKTLSGIIPALNGNILFNNKTIDSPKAFSHNISIVLNEKPPVSLSVYEVLSLGRIPYSNLLQKLKKNDIEIIDEISSLLEIKHLFNKKIDKISDGERQLVMIARTMIQKTPLILLDEPTTHLDLKNKSLILNILKTLSSRDKIVVFSTHDINLIIDLVDEFWVINNQQLNRIIDKNKLTKVLSNLFNSENLIFDKNNMNFKITNTTK